VRRWPAFPFSQDSAKPNSPSWPNALSRAVSRQGKLCSPKVSPALASMWSSPDMSGSSRVPLAGRKHVLSIEGPGSSVAELPVFDGGNYPASVTAVDEATLLFVSKQDFQSLCLAHPQVSLKVLRVVGARLRRLVGIIEELSFTTVRYRLLAFLVRLAKTSGKRTNGGIEITLPANNQELASQIGTVRELVSRNLSRFHAEGMLKIEGRSVILTDLEALESELQSAD